MAKPTDTIVTSLLSIIFYRSIKPGGPPRDSCFVIVAFVKVNDLVAYAIVTSVGTIIIVGTRFICYFESIVLVTVIITLSRLIKCPVITSTKYYSTRSLKRYGIGSYYLPFLEYFHSITIPLVFWAKAVASVTGIGT